MPADAVSLKGDDARVALRVTPKAGRDALDGLMRDASGQQRLRVKVATVPEDGKANAAVVKLLAKAWGVPRSSLTLILGETGRDKLIEVEGGAEPVALWWRAYDKEET